MILDRPICLACIATRACLDPVTADDAVRTVARFLKVAVVPRFRCLNCDETRVTFSINADSTTPAHEAACIAVKANLTLMATDDALTEIGKSLQLTALPRSRCRNCGDIAMTDSIGERLDT